MSCYLMIPPYKMRVDLFSIPLPTQILWHCKHLSPIASFFNNQLCYFPNRVTPSCLYFGGILQKEGKSIKDHVWRSFKQFSPHNTYMLLFFYIYLYWHFMLNARLIREFDKTNENTMTVLPVGFTQHQSGVDRVEVPLYLSAGSLRENQKTMTDWVLQ